ncbi:hypothetical protein FA15DRAFT_666356 [Coprinopsis marcescibilis]|uniref:Cora-domain-containing protein n=1 Tax=Coprinopsis marcescibilis TaxID=230819 RepID=A0A5C3L451_COPMA|nr:hypothetical protein FA15DRAFT_666356 [Coprinopsis marcescibilis]
MLPPKTSFSEDQVAHPSSTWDYQYPDTDLRSVVNDQASQVYSGPWHHSELDAQSFIRSREARRALTWEFQSPEVDRRPFVNDQETTPTWDLQYPEIDTRSFAFDEDGKFKHKFGRSSLEKLVDTSIDVLTIQFPTEHITDGQNERQYVSSFRPGLNHEEIVAYFKSTPTASLQVIFLNDIPSPVHSKHFPELREPPAALGPDTAEYLVKELGVSPIFISAIAVNPDPHVFRILGNACFQGRNQHEKTQIDGLYRLSQGLNTRKLGCNVWFSHTLGSEGTSTYIITGCPGQVKHNILCTAEKPSNSPLKLLRPLTVDAFLAEALVDEYSKEFLRLRARLVYFEHENMAEGTADVGMKRSFDTNRTVKDLHILSQHFHIQKEYLTELIERLGYLRRLHNTVTQPDSSDQPAALPSNALDFASTSTAHSFDYMLSNVKAKKGWTQNYIDRTSILINMLFNFSNQRDNQTNLRVADYTRKIAIATQRDSSSMIAMAAVTMFFLPGAFVSAIFSMVFFETNSGNNGTFSIQMSPQLWIFFVITVPLTIAVFVLWYLLRSHIHLKNLSAFNSGENDAKALDGNFLEPLKPYTIPTARGAEIKIARYSQAYEVDSFIGAEDSYIAPRPPSPPKRFQYIPRNLKLKFTGLTTSDNLETAVTNAPHDHRLQLSPIKATSPLTSPAFPLKSPHSFPLNPMGQSLSVNGSVGSVLPSEFSPQRIPQRGTSSRLTGNTIAESEDHKAEAKVNTNQPHRHFVSTSEMPPHLYDSTLRDSWVDATGLQMSSDNRIPTGGQGLERISSDTRGYHVRDEATGWGLLRPGLQVYG